MWSYLFMYVYLREKEPTEYNGWEQYVAEQIGVSPIETGFIPCNNAIALKERDDGYIEELHDAGVRGAAANRLAIRVELGPFPLLAALWRRRLFRRRGLVGEQIVIKAVEV